MKVVGLDLSLTSTGVCVVTDTQITVERVESKGTATATLADRAERLDRVTYEVCAAAGEIEMVVIEGPSMGSVHGHAHDRSGLWWLVVMAFHSAGIPVVEVSPSQRMVYATGKGMVKKDAVLAAVIKRWPHVDVTGNDEADALVLAAMGARALGQPIDTVPQTHLRAMDKVAWPVGVGT